MDGMSEQSAIVMLNRWGRNLRFKDPCYPRPINSVVSIIKEERNISKFARNSGRKSESRYIT